MTYQTRAVFFAVALPTAVFVASAGVWAQEGGWRRWGGPQGDFTTDSTDLAESWPETGPLELWSRPLGAGHTSILVDEGRLFTMYRARFRNIGSLLARGTITGLPLSTTRPVTPSPMAYRAERPSGVRPSDASTWSNPESGFSRVTELQTTLACLSRSCNTL